MERRLRHIYEFGSYRLDTGEQLLLREDKPVALTPKAFETLVALVERRGRLVEKEELMKTVWPDSFVEEASLTHNIWTLRKKLGSEQSGQSFIETVPKRGYRFTAEVRDLSCADAELILEKHTLSHIVTEEEEHDESEANPETIPAISSLPGLAQKPGRMTGRAKVMIAALCLSLMAAGVVALYRPSLSRRGAPSSANAVAQPQLRSIAVLPFKTIGTEGESDYLGIGMTEALIARLGYLRQLVVRPASAVSRYTDEQRDAVDAGREQGVDAVLDGSVQRAGDRIRVTVQLLRVQDRAVLWAGQFDERLTDIFAVQDSISQQVAQGLAVKLNDEERGQLRKRTPENIEAYQAYLKGRYFWNKRTPEGYKKAIDYFNQAIELDPAYAQAYAGLADAILFLGGDGNAGIDEAMARGKAALTKAIEIDDSLAEPHATLGLLAMNVDWNWTEAEREYRRAIELNPNYATAHHWYGEFLTFMGRFDEGLAEIKRAQELDPLSLIISTDMGKVYFLARRYDLTIEQCKKVLEMDPNFVMAHAWLGFAYSAQGRHEDAIAEFLKMKEMANTPWWLSFLGYVYGRAGHREEAQKILKRLTELSKQTYVSHYSLVLVYIGLGEKDVVFKLYEKVFEEHRDGVIDLKVNPGFDPLRSDPRFADLLRRANFAS
jgi:TolB-like protein/DNA-binding winged helix-turn-helix (wHTH) protein/Flp pilus assembly protein TadD